MLASVSAAILAAALTQAPSPAVRILAVIPTETTLTYGIVHKLHKVDGASKEVEGKVALAPDGKVQVMLRAPIVSFKSGEASRDANMAEILEAAKYSYVTYKGVGQIDPPSSFPATSEVTLRGELDLHGRKLAQAVPVKVTWASPTEAQVKANFSFSLDAYGIERPSLLFIKIEDDCRIAADLKLKLDGGK